MSENLEQKKLVVSEIAKKFQSAQSVIVVNYNGLTVEQVTALRSKFRESGVDYCVYKNTLVRRAVDELKIEGIDDMLTGPSAFAFGMKDPVSPAKIIVDFISKTKTEAISIKTGLLEGVKMTNAQIQSLAATPSREVLLSRLVGSLQSSIASFVRVLDAIAKKDTEQPAEAAEAAVPAEA